MILVSLIGLSFMVPMGIASAAAAIIGEKLGQNRVSAAKAYLRVMSQITVVSTALIQVGLYLAKD